MPKRSNVKLVALQIKVKTREKKKGSKQKKRQKITGISMAKTIL